MATTTLNPTAFETPDSGQPGSSAVTGATATGHAATTSTSPGVQIKTCRWSGVPAASGQLVSMTLKVDHTSSGTIVGGGTNQARLQYTLNGGGAWTDIINRVNYTASQGPTTFSLALSLSQDLTAIQVRDLIEADNLGGGSASATVTIANILVEVVTIDPQVIVMM